MATVVFMRGVNVGGRRRFRPARLAEELSSLGVVSIGAAGTFVVRKRIGRAALRTELLARLPFEAEVVTCRGGDLIDLVSAEPFPRRVPGRDVRRFVSVLVRRPSRTPRFPLLRPSGGAWQVKLLGLHGRFALSLLRRTAAATTVYPNEVVEKALAVGATTRTWDTMIRVRETLCAG